MSIHSTPSAKSESGSATFTASSSEHLRVQKLELDAFLTQQVQSSLNRKLLTLLAKGAGGEEGKKKSFSYTSGCPFSVPRTQSCPQISPDNTASLHLPEEEIAGERSDGQN